MRNSLYPGSWFLVLLLCLGGRTLSAAQHVSYTVLLHGKSPAKVSAITLNGRDYLSLTDVAHSMFPGSKCSEDGSEVLIGKDRLRCSPASFFIARENAAGLRMTQMPYPALDIGKQVYIPVLPLCIALQTLGWYDVTVKDRTITLRPFTSKASLATLFSSQPQEVEETEEDAPLLQPGKRQPEKGKLKEETGNIITGLGHVKSESSIIFDDIRKTIVPSTSAWQHVGTMQHPVKELPRESEPETGTGYPRTDTTPTPGHYVLPPDLLRRELENTDTTHILPKDSSHSDYMREKPGPLLAMLDEHNDHGLSMLSGQEYQREMPLAYGALNTEPVRIEKMSVEDHGDHIELTLEADGPISSFQRPEYTGGNLVLRIANARNGYMAMKALQKCGIRSVRAEQVGDMLVYRISCAKSIEKCTYSRQANHLTYQITISGMEGKTGRVVRESSKWLLDVIVLDAGHGGKDVGAESIHGYQEKNITLAVVKKLGKLIEKNMPQTKVVYTRKDDRFIELYRRGQIANEAGGKLFISVHCNSMPSKPHPANGFEAYILRPGRNEDAVRVAERENEAIKFEKNQSRYKALTDEQFIVVNMAQSSFVKFSELFASLLQQEVGRTTSLQSRGVNQAGFFVLVGASMPNVLFETAFLSNKQDEKLITSEKGQEAIAEGMFRAVKTYAEKYEHLLEAQK